MERPPGLPMKCRFDRWAEGGARVSMVRGVTPVIALTICAGAAFAQDSVSTMPGAVDALSPYGVQTARYVVDLVTVAGSWGHQFAFAPVLKASAGPIDWGLAQANASAAASPDQRIGVTNTGGPFALWTTPGAGVNPMRNSAPGSVAVSSFDRVFSLALSDVGTQATNIVVAEIGQRSDDPSRLFVTRRVVASSRSAPLQSDSASLSLGAVDAHANVTFRADDFNAHAKGTISGDHIIRVDATARTNAVNAIFKPTPAGPPAAGDPGATTFAIASAESPFNTPTSIPESQGGPRAITHDFTGNHVSESGGGGLKTTAHIGPAMDAHRGNPAFFTRTILGGIGTITSLARSISGGRADALNLYGVDESGAVTGVRAERLPPVVTDPISGFSVALTGNPVFHHYWSQVSFRGPNGQAALGYDIIRSVPIAAATGRSNASGDFIAVARLGGGGGGGPAEWVIAAHIGKPILNGSNGTAIATIAPRNPVAISSPALDDQGNVYFIANTERIGGGHAHALIKAVNTPSGYKLEEILRVGQSFTGANSATPFTVSSLTLGDSDSIASASLHAGSIVAGGGGRLPGVTVTYPAQATALGGLAVSAILTYDNMGVPESYHALLYLTGVASPNACLGDLNGDLMVDVDDLNIILGAWQTTPVPGQGADLSADGVVDVDDLNIVLSHWQDPCAG